MTFMEDKTDDFLRIFNAAQHKIESFLGCKGVDLCRDGVQKNLYFTISIWESPETLHAYRNSELFKTTWEETKKLFSERPEAWSVDKLK